MNYVHIEPNQCKGCRLCINACTPHCIVLGEEINAIGYQSAVFRKGTPCTACGLCFYVCPEPGAITVLQDEPDEEGEQAEHTKQAEQAVHHGAAGSIRMKSTSAREVRV